MIVLRLAVTDHQLQIGLFIPKFLLSLTRLTPLLLIRMISDLGPPLLNQVLQAANLLLR